MSVNKTPDSLAKPVTDKTAITQQVTKPAEQKPDSLQSKQIAQLPINPLAQSQAKDVPQKGFDSMTAIRVQNLLKDTSRSTLDKLKSLLPIPASLTPIIEMFLGKKTQAGVKVSIENSSLKLIAALNMPGQGIKGTAALSLPMTAQPTKDSMTELHPAISGLLSKALNPLVSEEQQVKDLIKLISTLPSERVNFVWANGAARIVVTLPNGATLNLNLSIPTSQKSAETPDILRTFLKSILKENYAGIEILLSQDMTFNWDGSTSRFDIEFPKQLALHITKVSENYNAKGLFDSLISRAVNAVTENTTVIIPKNIRGTIDFKNSTIQMDKDTTFNTMGIPDFTIDTISFNPEKNEINVKYEALFTTLTYTIELAPTSVVAEEKKVNFEFIPIDTNADQPAKNTKGVQTQTEIDRAKLISKIKEKVAKQPASIQPKAKEVSKSKISVFESLKQMIKIPETLEPVLKIFLADQTKLDVTVGIEDNLTVSVNEVNIPKLGVSGKASLSIPTQVQVEAETMPVNLHPTIDSQLAKLLTKELKPLEETTLLTNLIDLALRMPNQDMHMIWEGGMGLAQLAITLPGGMVLKLELNVTEKDILRTKLTEILGSQFADIEPLLDQTFNFIWNGATKEFSFKFLEQQKLTIKSVKLKKGGFFQNMLRKFVSWITRNRVITLPKEIHGKVNFETASVEFQKGTSFTIHTALGVSKKLGLRLFSFARDNMIDIGFRCFGSQAIEIDTRTSNVESAQLAILENTALTKQVHRNRE